MSEPTLTAPVENTPAEDVPTNSSPVKRGRVGRGKAPTTTTANTVGIVITVDHVYLPIGDDGNVVPAWTAPNVSTRKVLRRTHLRVPADLARFLSDRDQAEITDAATATATAAKETP